jgi:hypothetical protein
MNLTPENQARIIIENTLEERMEYDEKSNGGAGYGLHVAITKEELKALQEGKCLALNNDEYSTFITLE